MNNNDKQLLIDASRAVGLVIGSEWDCAESGILIGNGDGDLTVYNPLENNTDAFRLMVDLDIDVNFNDYYVDTYCGKSGYGEEYSHYGSKQECVRRAIVLAAAELGRARHDQA